VKKPLRRDVLAGGSNDATGLFDLTRDVLGERDEL